MMPPLLKRNYDGSGATSLTYKILGHPPLEVLHLAKNRPVAASLIAKRRPYLLNVGVNFNSIG